MRFVRSVAIPLTFAVAAIGCDDDPTGPQISDLVGDWDASKFEYARPDGSNKVNITAIGGEFTATVNGDGTFTAELLEPGAEQPAPLAGTLTIQGDDTLLVDFTDLVNQAGFEDLIVTFTLDGDVLTWNADDVGFDFDQDGTDEDATLEVILDRI